MANSRAARTTLELTLNPEYVKDWGVWEAIREFLQNALDSQDLGYKAEISYVTNTKEPQLRIVTEGVTIDRDTLLLGTTNKSGRNNQRGEFGEGMKLACLVLVRNGLKVRIKSGNEQWTPKIDFSGNFNSELLMVDTAPCKYRNQVQVDVIGLSPNDWKTIQSRVLDLKKPKKDEVMSVGYNKILMGDRFQNLLFVKGIFVCQLPGKYYFGYDLDSVSLDRDRRLADPWDLRYAISKTLESAVSKDLLPIHEVMTILNGDFEEHAAVASNVYNSNALSKGVTAAFVKKHGEETIPVSDTAQSVEARHYGFNTVVVSKGIKSLIEQELGDFETKKKSKKYDIKQRYSVSDLTEEEELNLMWAFELVSNVEPDVDNVTVAEFFDEKVRGLFKDGEIYLAKKIMMDRQEVIRVTIHEAAHHYGADGTNEHSDGKDDIAARIITNLSK